MLADRILRRESDDLLLDGARQRALGRGIKRALALIRHSHPAMAEISVRQDVIPGRLLLGLDGPLRDAVAGTWGDGDAATVPQTGHAAFDALNETLGLRSVLVYAALDALTLQLDERANIAAATGAYEAIDGVTFAEPDAALGDGSDVEAAKEHDTWHVVFRKAWGDCPAGCMFEVLSFFIVADGEVERIEPVRARAMEPFATLLANQRLALIRKRPAQPAAQAAGRSKL